MPDSPKHAPAPIAQITSLLGDQVELIDLSDLMSNATSSVEPMPHRIEYLDHAQTAVLGRERFGVEPEDWKDGLAYASENVTATTHSGTHMDAPWHYAPTSGGRPARTIDEVPLDWCLRPGVLLDMRGIDRVRGITADDVEAELERIGYTLAPLDIVLVRTGASDHYGEAGYHLWGPGLRRSATALLVERGVKIIGIDAWGLDRPFDVMAEEVRAGDREQLWESHKYGAEREYLQLERLANLDALPCAHGFLVAAFPCRIERASAAWTRVVAIVDKAADEGNRKEMTPR
jgi:kynurenine formamidase